MNSICKLLLFILISVFSAHSFAAKNSVWKSFDLPGVDKAWSQGASAHEVVTFVQNKNSEQLGFEATPTSEIASGIIGMRFMTLQTLGFKDFKVTGFKIQNKNAAYVVLMSGRYTTPENAIVHFFERQTYRERKFSQLSYLVQKSKLTAQDNENARKTLNEFADNLQREPASTDSKTEATGLCEDCLDKELGLAELKAQTEALKATVETKTAPADSCQANSFIDPKQKSILEEKKSWLQKVGLSGEKSENPMAIAGRSAVTCIYGAGKGVYGSLKDLVEAIPTLAGWTWKGLKSAGSAVVNTDYKALMQKFSPQNILEGGKKAYQVTRDTVVTAYDKSSKMVYESYKEGGATGAAAAVAQAAYNSSPHKVVGKFLADIGSKIAEAVSEEWGSFKCLDAETMSQVVCNVAGYLMTDIYTGNLIISGLSKSAKLKDAIKVVKGAMFKEDKALEVAKKAEKLEELKKANSVEGLTKSVEELKIGKVDADVVRASEETLSTVEKVAIKTEKENLDLNLVRTAMDDAKATGQTDALEALKKAYQGLEEASGGEAKLSKASMDKWEKKLKAEKPELTQQEIAKARQCLFGAVK